MLGVLWPERFVATAWLTPAPRSSERPNASSGGRAGRASPPLLANPEQLASDRAPATLARNVPGVREVQNYLAVRSRVMPYVYWDTGGLSAETAAPPELRKDPWDPQDPAARP